MKNCIMWNSLSRTLMKFLHYILVLIVKVDRLLRRQKIRIMNPAAMDKINTITGPIIFAPTHCGKYDIQVMTEVLWRFRWSLLSGDPFDLPGTVEGYWLKFNGVVYVDRDDKKYRKRAKQEMLRLLKAGENIMLYPEGTWNFSPNQPVLSLFRGVADIAVATDATVILSLMELYLSEWQHRDNLFFKEIFTYFFSSLVVMILPFADIWNLHFPKEIPQWLFPAIGMLMAVAFFIVSNGYIARLGALSDPYQKLIDKLPPELRREKVKDMYSGVWGAVMNWRMASFICWFMFLALMGIGTTLLYFTIN